MAAKKVNFAAWGQVGFPRFLPPVAGKGGFPLKETPIGRPLQGRTQFAPAYRDLIALKVRTAILFLPSTWLGMEIIQPRSFP